MIYFDNAATTKPLNIALNSYLKTSTQIYANPSSLHSEGRAAKDLIEKSRDKIKDAICYKVINKNNNKSTNKSTKGEIIFTSSATLSNNIAIIGKILYLKDRIKNRKVKILYSQADHPSIVETIKSIKEVEFLSINFDNLYKVIREGNDVKDYITSKYYELIEKYTPDMIILQWVNNENGLILDIEKIVNFAKDKNNDLSVHVDAVQGFLKLPFFNIENIDTISFSAHKFGGLKGCGFLYIEDIKKLKAILFGGGQMGGLYPSTENVAAIASTSYVVEYLFDSIEERIKNNIFLKEKLLDEINKNKELKDNIFALTDEIEKNNFSPYIIKIYNKILPASVLQNILNDNGVMVSIGSACSSNKKNMIKDNFLYGIPIELADKGIRISFFTNEKQEEIVKFIEILNEIILKFKNW